MSTWTVTPPANVTSITVNGRTYTCAAGASIAVVSFDAAVMCANGWERVAVGGLAAVALSGAYSDLSGKPMLPGAMAVGKAVLVGGTKDVADTTVTTTTKFFLTQQVAGGTPGTLSVVITAGVGFTINSSNNLDTSTVAWLKVEG